MHPIITSELARERYDRLVTQAENARRARLAAGGRRTEAEPRARRSRQTVAHPICLVQGWLARGYL